MSDGLLVQTMQRIMSVLDDIDERKADIKEIYREANGHGFDKAAIGVAIREIRGRAKADTPKAQERAAIVDLYVSTFDNAPRTYVHVPAREGHGQNPSREHAPVTQEEAHVDRGASAQPHSAEGEPAIPSEAGDAGTGQAVQEPETGIGQPSGAGTGSAVRAGAPVSETADPDRQPSVQNEAEAGASPEQGSAARADREGEDVAAAHAGQFVTPTGEGEGRPGDVPSEPASSPAAEASASPIGRKPFVLRPHCQRPEMCGSYGSKHCAECERAAKAGEDEEAAVVPAFVRKTHDHPIGEQA